MIVALVWYQASFTDHHVGLLGFGVYSLRLSIHMLACKRRWNEAHKLGLPALLFAPLSLVIFHTCSLMHCAIPPVLPNQSKKSHEELLYFSISLVLLCICYDLHGGLWCGLAAPFAKHSDRTVFSCQVLLISLWEFIEVSFLLFSVDWNRGRGDGAHLGRHILFQGDGFQSC